MKKINILLTLLSLNAVLIIIERLSPTTKILLQPYNFLRFHEFFQMIVVISLSIVIPFLILKYLSDNFENLKTRRGTILGVTFILGIYFTATGNGAHEIASFLYNTFCNTKIIGNGICAASFFDDYYFGNIVYFIGLFLTTVSLVLVEIENPSKNFSGRDLLITSANGLVSAFTFFAYGAFDKVLIGLYFCIISAVFVDLLLLRSRLNFRKLPFTFYSALGYTISAIGILLYRFH